MNAHLQAPFMARDQAPGGYMVPYSTHPYGRLGGGVYYPPDMARVGRQGRRFKDTPLGRFLGGLLGLTRPGGSVTMTRPSGPSTIPFSTGISYTSPVAPTIKGQAPVASSSPTWTQTAVPMGPDTFAVADKPPETSWWDAAAGSAGGSGGTITPDGAATIWFEEPKPPTATAPVAPTQAGSSWLLPGAILLAALAGGYFLFFRRRRKGK